MTRGPGSLNDLIVIPARFGSSRLPGKPLLTLGGRTMLDRVYANAKKASDLCGNCAVVVATDDERIANHAEALGAQVALTETTLDCGTARAHAAVLQQPRLPENVVCLQGDAPFITPQVIAGVLETLRNSSVDVATPVYHLDWDRLDRLRKHKITAPFSGTTCLRDPEGRALWFSKSILPAIRNEDSLRKQSMSPVWQHLGLYAYTSEALDWFVAKGQGTYEMLEGLEQLRFLEHGRTIMTVPVDPPSHALSGIDTPADLDLAEEAIARLGDPLAA